MLDVIKILNKLNEQFLDIRLTVYKWEKNLCIRTSILYNEEMYHYQRMFTEIELESSTNLEDYYIGEVIRKFKKELSSE